MSRLFNVEVFNRTISGGATKDAFGKAYHSGEDSYGLLGSADGVKVQVIVDAVAEGDTQVKVEIETTNAPQEETWVAIGGKGSLTLIDDAKDAPVMDFSKYILPEDVGAYVRFRVSADRGGATVRVIAAGWGK